MADPRMKELLSAYASPVAEKKSKPKSKTPIINIALCKYPAVRMAIDQLKWTIVKYHPTSRLGCKSDMFWVDNHPASERLPPPELGQLINRFPGMDLVCTKRALVQRINPLRRLFPEEYAFFPQSYILPEDHKKLEREWKGKKERVLIVKPDVGCQGDGIFLTTSARDVCIMDRPSIAQEYVPNPLLVDGLKWDCRLYVLITSARPLRVYVHREGLARFATKPYEPPTSRNLREFFMHLTNYSLNKISEEFKEVDDDTEGSKRKLSAVWDQLKEQGVDVGQVWSRIHGLIARTMIAVQPVLLAEYLERFPTTTDRFRCCQLLGVDVMLDEEHNPWLLEINNHPSIATGDPPVGIDVRVKTQVLRDMIELVLKPRQRNVMSVEKEKNLWEQSEALQREVAMRDACEKKLKGEWERVDVEGMPVCIMDRPCVQWAFFENAGVRRVMTSSRFVRMCQLCGLFTEAPHLTRADADILFLQLASSSGRVIKFSDFHSVLLRLAKRLYAGRERVRLEHLEALITRLQTAYEA